jgi:hypothetical protein
MCRDLYRIEIDTVFNCRPGKRERSLGGRLLKTAVLHETSEAAALNEVASMRDAMGADGSDYAQTVGARIWAPGAFDAALAVWKSGPIGGTIHTLDAAQCASLPSPAPSAPECDATPDQTPEPSLADLGQLALSL